MIKAQLDILREKMGEHLDAAETIEQFASSESRQMTETELTEYNEHLDSIDALKPQVEALQRREDFAAKLAAKKGAATPGELVEAGPNAASPYPVPRALVGRRFNLKMFKGEHAVNDAYAAGQQLLATIGNERAQGYCNEHALIWFKGAEIQNAQTGDVDAAGGYTVPDPLSATYIEFRDSVGICARVSFVAAMTSDTLRVPKLLSGQTVQYPGQATDIPATDTVWGQVSLSAVKRATLTKISREVQNDSVIRFAEAVASRAAYELVKRQDIEFVQGDGNAGFGGVHGLESATAVGTAGAVTASGNSWAGITTDDLSAVMAKLPERHQMGASWICSRTFFHSVIEPLILAQGGSTGAEMMAGANAMLLGKPVYFTDAAPIASGATQKCLWYGNFTDAVILGQREQIELFASDHYAMNEDVTTQRLTTRYDIQIHEGSDNSEAKGIVYLVTAT